MKNKQDDVGARVGLLGELAVEMEIVKQGWHPVRLDTAQMASNADLLAINRTRRVAIQVKTSDARGHGENIPIWLSFGYATSYLKDSKRKTPIFNSKKSPLLADVVIGVNYSDLKSRFVVMPVAVAEKLCRLHCEYWYAVPTKDNGRQRSNTFPIYLPLTAERGSHKKHYDFLRKQVALFENAWHVLSCPVQDLHDLKKWPFKK